MREYPVVSVGLVVALVVTTLSGLAAQSAAAQNVEQVGPPMKALEIGVQDMKTKEKLGRVSPGAVIQLEPGDRVRLRMVALPAARHRAPRYPSTRFAAVATNGRISFSEVDEAAGSVVITALEGRDSGTATISYKLLEPVNISADLHEGTLTVEVVDVAPPPPPAAAPPPPRRGVTLYQDADFRGTSVTFYEDERDLRRTRLGNDSVTSVRVDPGCRVKMFEHTNYQGTWTVISRDLDAVHGTELGSDQASSIMVRCSDDDDWGPEWSSDTGATERRRGITLFEYTGFRGRSETFYEDQPDLRRSQLGSDTASSIEVDSGCEVELYEDAGYSGRRTVLSEDLDDLYDARVGDNSVSSLKIDCSF